jgi:hypothetical protein
VDGISDDFGGTLLERVYMASRLGNQEMGTPHLSWRGNTPLNIAEALYSKGEFTKEQF